MGRILAGAVVVVVLVGVWALWRSDEPPPAAPATAAAQASATRPPPLPALPAFPARPERPAAAGSGAKVPDEDDTPEAAARRAREVIRARVAERAPTAPGVGDHRSPEAPSERKTAGSMRKEAVREGIRLAKDAIAECYEQALASNPELGGTLTVEFLVKANEGTGRLHEASVAEDTLGNPFLGMCALKAIAAIEFEAEMDGEVVVKYPFRFSPGPAEEKEAP